MIKLTQANGAVCYIRHEDVRMVTETSRGTSFISFTEGPSIEVEGSSFHIINKLALCSDPDPVATDERDQLRKDLAAAQEKIDSLYRSGDPELKNARARADEFERRYKFAIQARDAAIQSWQDEVTKSKCKW